MTKVLTIILTAALISACSESTQFLSPSPPTIGTIHVSASTSSLVLGDSMEVRATATEADGSPFRLTTVVWTSSNVAIATVTATGPLTAEVRTISAGTVTIRATVEPHFGQRPRLAGTANFAVAGFHMESRDWNDGSDFSSGRRSKLRTSHQRSWPGCRIRHYRSTLSRVCMDARGRHDGHRRSYRVR
jgi:hypothetical protein